MSKINSSDTKLNTVNNVALNEAGKVKENATDNSLLELEKADENGMVALSAEADSEKSKNFFKVMIDLVVDFFKKIFWGDTKDDSKAEDETPKIDETVAKSVDAKLGDGFSNKVEDVSKNINCDPTDLLTVLFCESSLDPEAENKSGAVGIMQFMPSTLKELGYTTEDIKNMTATQQLDVVQKYFEKNNYYHKGEKLTAAQLYAMVLAPGKANREILYIKGKDGQAYLQNKGLDIDENGQIAMQDLDTHIANKCQEMQESLAV